MTKPKRPTTKEAQTGFLLGGKVQTDAMLFLRHSDFVIQGRA
jgi:hypothetical protein